MLLAELHPKHFGMNRMIALARSYIWWPRLNTDIEETCHKCNECLLSSDNPAMLHCILALCLSSHEKEFMWIMLLGVKFCTMFATHGISITFVSNNRPCFASAEFKQFGGRTTIKFIPTTYLQIELLNI